MICTWASNTGSILPCCPGSLHTPPARCDLGRVGPVEGFCSVTSAHSVRAVGLGCLQHVVTLDDLDALTALGLAQAALVRVEAVPALPGRVRNLLAFEELDDGVLVGVRGAREVDGVLEKIRDGFVGVTLGVADESDGAALDPAGD